MKNPLKTTRFSFFPVLLISLCMLFSIGHPSPAASDTSTIETPPMPGQVYKPSGQQPKASGTPPGRLEDQRDTEALPPEVRSIDEQIRESTRILSEQLDQTRYEEPTVSNAREADPVEPARDRQEKRGSQRQPETSPRSRNEKTQTPPGRKSKPVFSNQSTAKSQASVVSPTPTNEHTAAQSSSRPDDGHAGSKTHSTGSLSVELGSPSPAPDSFLRTLAIRSALLLALLASGFFVIRKYFFA